ncbi:MAG: SRPBCC domain-containing protein [Ktedonobacteraceae bacterium]|nr:SRPBCC domain-containing protein [Ktedonobacteraceae bacterium]
MIVAESARITPDTLFNYWTAPELLQKWWPPEAEIEPHLGGAYHLYWRQMNWHLYGQYTDFVPGATLAFTWQWDHYPVVKNVLVTLESFNEDGTRMTAIVHMGIQSRTVKIGRVIEKDGCTSHFAVGFTCLSLPV